MRKYIYYLIIIIINWISYPSEGNKLHNVWFNIFSFFICIHSINKVLSQTLMASLSSYASNWAGVFNMASTSFSKFPESSDFRSLIKSCKHWVTWEWLMMLFLTHNKIWTLLHLVLFCNKALVIYMLASTKLSWHIYLLVLLLWKNGPKWLMSNLALRGILIFVQSNAL